MDCRKQTPDDASSSPAVEPVEEGELLRLRAEAASAQTYDAFSAHVLPADDSSDEGPAGHDNNDNADAYQAFVVARYTVGTNSNNDYFASSSSAVASSQIESSLDFETVTNPPKITKDLPQSVSKDNTVAMPADSPKNMQLQAVRFSSSTKNLNGFEGFNVEDTYQVPNMAESYHSVLHSGSRSKRNLKGTFQNRLFK